MLPTLRNTAKDSLHKAGLLTYSVERTSLKQCQQLVRAVDVVLPGFN